MSHQNERNSIRPSGQAAAERATATSLQDPLGLIHRHNEELVKKMQTAESKAAVEALFPPVKPTAQP